MRESTNDIVDESADDGRRGDYRGRERHALAVACRGLSVRAARR
jgi:hypothetical protein